MAKAKYTPIGPRINLPNVVVQAAQALDVAADFAIGTKDAQALVRVAEGWVELGKCLGYDGEDEEVEETENPDIEVRRFGFTLVSDIGEEDEDGAEADC